MTGCGTTKSYTATEQLLISDAVDATIAKIDFGALSGKSVFLDTTYFKTHRTGNLIDSSYVISALRQQMVASGVLLVDSKDKAELIAEPRLGALGMDGHSVQYGIPANRELATASQALSGSTILPPLPEVSLVKRESKTGAAKVAVFAYDRETHEPFWQSGLANSSSSARETWVLGTGPWQQGTIYDGPQFAGEKIGRKDWTQYDPQRDGEKGGFRGSQAFASYRNGRTFVPEQPAVEPLTDADLQAVITASAEGSAAAESEAGGQAESGKAAGK